uniref:Putative licpodalin-4 1 n=2 Tax=Ixodes ricinus TaxID=34613 RepID=V5H152_IXORI
MYFTVPLSRCFVVFLFCSHSRSTTEAPRLPEDDPKNFPDQNATKSVELGGRHWVKRRTYTVTTSTGGPTCEYAQINGKVKENEYALELGAKFRSMWISRNLNIVVWKPPGQHPRAERAQFYQTKAMTDHWVIHFYTLITKDCHIVRIIEKRITYKYNRCDLLLTDGGCKRRPTH